MNDNSTYVQMTLIDCGLVSGAREEYVIAVALKEKKIQVPVGSRKRISA